MSEPRSETVRRYDGRTEHADWCKDHTHDGLCLDFLTGWEPVKGADIGRFGQVDP